MKASTFRLEQEIGKATDLRQFVQEYREEFLTEPPHEYLNNLMAEKNLTVAQVCERSGLGNYGYKIFSGARNPSRDAAMRLALGMELTVEQVQRYLRLAQIARLDARSCRDAAVLFALDKGMTVQELQTLLAELGEKEL